MNWDDLQLFLAVARTGSVSGAARRLAVQHSTVSRRLHKFEESLGVRLIERKKSGYELTEAGEALRQSAERIEQEVLEVDGRVQGKDTQLSGPLRVTAINNMASTVLMPMFAEFSRKHPAVELHLLVSNADVSLPEREADVAIRLTNHPSETLIGKRLVTVSSTIYGHQDYIRRLNDHGEPPEWLGVTCCVFHRSWTRQHCEQADHRVYSDDTLLTQAALREGLGVSFLPCFMGYSDPLLARYCAPDPAHDLGLWLLWHPDLRRTARLSAFCDHMKEAVLNQQRLFMGQTDAA